MSPNIHASRIALARINAMRRMTWRRSVSWLSLSVNPIFASSIVKYYHRVNSLRCASLSLLLFHHGGTEENESFYEVLQYSGH